MREPSAFVGYVAAILIHRRRTTEHDDGQRRSTLRRSCNNARTFARTRANFMILRRINPRTSRFFARFLRLAALMSFVLVPISASAQEDDQAPSRVGRVADVGGQLFLAP